MTKWLDRCFALANDLPAQFKKSPEIEIDPKTEKVVGILPEHLQKWYGLHLCLKANMIRQLGNNIAALGTNFMSLPSKEFETKCVGLGDEIHAAIHELQAAENIFETSVLYEVTNKKHFAIRKGWQVVVAKEEDQ